MIVWNLVEKRATFTFLGHNRPVNAVAFLADGKTLVSAGVGAVRFWDLEHAQLRGSLLNLAGVAWLAVSPDGNYRSSDNAEGRFAHRVREENDRLRDLAPDDFRKVYGWTNRPELVRLSGE